MRSKNISFDTFNDTIKALKYEILGDLTSLLIDITHILDGLNMDLVQHKDK